jgi:hypothetical protein
MTRRAARTLVLVLLASGLAVAGENRPARVAMPEINIEKSGKCVAPADEMRRNHMKMLLHQRDQTMHQGVRGTPHSLKGCVDCHASSRTNSVLGKDGFCASCHAYAAVSIDCFECHSPLRRAQAAGTLR